VALVSERNNQGFTKKNDPRLCQKRDHPARKMRLLDLVEMLQEEIRTSNPEGKSGE